MILRSMPLFTSPREKRLWLYCFIVLLSIISTLAFGTPIVAGQLYQKITSSIGPFIMMLVGATVILHGLKVQASKIEIAILLGITAVYLILFIRLGHPERTHLMEYSVLAVFIHKALIERIKKGSVVLKAALIAFLFTFLIGILDECIQIFIPFRIFDPIDILFNGLAALLAIGLSLILNWVKMKMSKT